MWRLQLMPKARHATTQAKMVIFKPLGMSFYSLSPWEMKITANVISGIETFSSDAASKKPFKLKPVDMRQLQHNCPTSKGRVR